MQFTMFAFIPLLFHTLHTFYSLCSCAYCLDGVVFRLTKNKEEEEELRSQVVVMNSILSMIASWKYIMKNLLQRKANRKLEKKKTKNGK